MNGFCRPLLSFNLMESHAIYVVNKIDRAPKISRHMLEETSFGIFLNFGFP